MSEKFCLKWNDFEANVTKSFRQLRKADDFYDVTLVSDDHQQVSAHKIVLSASSEYFNNVLKMNKHSHPMLCLSGVTSKELTNILDYIYNGELQIYQEDLDQFLQIAQRFQLEGLIQGEEGERGDDHVDILTKGVEEAFEIEENMVMCSEPVGNSDIKVKTLKKKNEGYPHKIIAMEYSNFDNMEDLNKKLEEMFARQPDGKFVCNLCGKTTIRKNFAQEHAEVHMDGLSYPCEYCEKQFRSRASLRMHQKLHKN